MSGNLYIINLSFLGNSMPASENRKVHILVICVNYNSAEDTVKFAENTLTLNTSHSLDLLIINNSPDQNNLLKKSVQRDSRVKLLCPGTNLGYFGAASWGLEKYLSNAGLPEWVIISNTDIIFPDNNIIKKLYEFYPVGFDGVVAPKIHSQRSGVNQNPFMVRRPAKNKILFFRLIFRFYPVSFLYQLLSFIKTKIKYILGRNQISLVDEQKPHYIYAPHGSFIMFHRKYFEAGGDLKHGSFLFGEEIFVAEAISRLSLKVIYDPRLKVIHNEHRSSGNIKNKEMCMYVSKTYDYIYNQFYVR